MSSGTEVAIAALSTPGSSRRLAEHARREHAVVDDAAGQIVGGEQHAFLAEAGVFAARLDEVAQEERGDDEHDERERDLHAHQRAAQDAGRREPRARAKRA